MKSHQLSLKSGCNANAGTYRRKWYLSSIRGVNCIRGSVREGHRVRLGRDRSKLSSLDVKFIRRDSRYTRIYGKRTVIANSKARRGALLLSSSRLLQALRCYTGTLSWERKAPKPEGMENRGEWLSGKEKSLRPANQFAEYWGAGTFGWGLRAAVVTSNMAVAWGEEASMREEAEWLEEEWWEFLNISALTVRRASIKGM